MPGTLIEGFEARDFDAGGITIRFAIAGSGPPLLLLHGYPQTHALWWKIAPRLAQRFTVVAADLRGYGDSSKPAGLPDHSNYSKRAMAADQAALMKHLGFARYRVCGHDRGARVAHRLASDHRDAVERLAVLDIAPTLAMYERTDMAFARAYFHWFLLIQPAPFPETLIGANPQYLLKTVFGAWSRREASQSFAPAAMAEYMRCFCTPESVHATCEDYRASAGIDLEHDRADLGQKLTCPLLVVWGESGWVGRAYDPPALWRERATDVRGQAVPGGHFLPEESPEETFAALDSFF
jgi:haloacetate dehalogenase